MDSRPETKRHIELVRKNLNACASNLEARGINHDRTKLESPEVEYFDKYTPMLADCPYGSDEYKASLEAIKPAIDHHYAHNTHHPEHYPNGVLGMSMFDLIEMLCDWQASGKRHKDGNLLESMRINRERFNIPDALFEVMMNTVVEMDFGDIDG